MTDERPGERAAREADRLLREWGVDPEQMKSERQEREEQQREATRKELRHDPPEPHPRQVVTIQTPGGGVQYVNTRARETEAQRQARLELEAARDRVPEPEKQTEPSKQEKTTERVRKIDLEREILPPWEQDPRRG